MASGRHFGSNRGQGALAEWDLVWDACEVVGPGASVDDVARKVSRSSIVAASRGRLRCGPAVVSEVWGLAVGDVTDREAARPYWFYVFGIAAGAGSSRTSVSRPVAG